MPHRLQSESGAVLVEFAISFPLLLLVMLAIMDFGFLFQRYEVVTNAAREGARVAILPNYEQEDVEGRVREFLEAGGLEGEPTISTVTTGNMPLTGNRCATVKSLTVSYPHDYLFLDSVMDVIGAGNLADRPLSASSQMRSEAESIPC